MSDALYPYPTAMVRYPTLRQSLLSDFDNCKLTTAMKLELREEGDWSTHEAARGQLLHRTLAKCLIAMYENAVPDEGHDIDPDRVVGGTIDLNDATAIFLETLRQADVEPRDLVVVPLDQVKDLRWIVRKWARDSKFDIGQLVDVEQRLSATVRYPNPVGGYVERAVTGQLDALFIVGDETDHAVVLDWKDTWGIPAPQELGFDGYFQQRMYAFLVFSNYPTVKRVTLREQYVRFSESREATIWREDMENIEAELAALVEGFDRAIEFGVPMHSRKARDMRKAIRDTARERDRSAQAGNMEHARELAERYSAQRRVYENTVGPWKPSPGHHCGFCPRPTACPIFPAARGAGRILTQRDAERVAGETIVADKAAKKGKDALNVWASRNGPIPVKDTKGERIWGHRPTTRTSRPTLDEVEKELDHARLVGRKPDVESLYKTAQTTRFELHQPKPKTDDAADEDADLLTLLEASLREVQARKDAAAG